MLREFSEEGDVLLREGRLAGLLRTSVKDGQGKTGLARMTAGWKWAHDFRKGLTNKVVRIDPNFANYTTIASEHNLGHVDQLYGVNNSSKVTKPLKGKVTSFATALKESRGECASTLLECIIGKIPESCQLMMRSDRCQ